MDKKAKATFEQFQAEDLRKWEAEAAELEQHSAEYSDGRHKSDKRRHDPNDCKKTAFCSFDKCFVNIDLCGQTVNDDA